MTKLLIGLLSLALVGTGGLVAAVGGFDTEPALSVSVPAATTDRDTTTDRGTTTSRTTTLGTTTLDTTTGAATTAGGTTTTGDDISGPCDEAEHANDPRCTGAAGGDDDNSGPGSGDDDRDDRDDRDNSGPGGGDDDRDDDDRSGSNSGRG
jgi:hypothetical protein